MPIDFFEDTTPQVSDESLKRIATIAQRMLNLQAEYDALESQLQQIKYELRKVREEELPEAMDQVNMKSFTLADGSVINIKDNIYAAIPKRNQAKAYNWLRENGYGDLIKNEVKVPFSRGHDNLATMVKNWLESNDVSYMSNETVHPQTLNAWVREQLEVGVNLPLDLFGVFQGRKAVVKT